MTVLTEAERIKDRLRACTTLEDVERVAAEERGTVSGWRGQPGDAGVMFVQIVKLKAHMLWRLKARRAA